MYMDNIKVKGIVFIQTLKKHNGVWRVEYTHTYQNLITDQGIEILRDSLVSGILSPIKFLGIGTGDTTVSSSDTEIEDEIFRIQYDYTTPVGSKMYFNFYIAPDEANDTWKNIGLLTADETLFSHLNCNEFKNSSTAKNVSYYIEF